MIGFRNTIAGNSADFSNDCAITCDGDDDYFSPAQGSELGPSVTDREFACSMWVYIDGYTSSDANANVQFCGKGFIQQSAADNKGWGFGYSTYTDKLLFDCYAYVSAEQKLRVRADYSLTINSGSWHHYACVRRFSRDSDGTLTSDNECKYEIYYDGALVGSTTANDSSNALLKAGTAIDDGSVSSLKHRCGVSHSAHFDAHAKFADYAFYRDVGITAEDIKIMYNNGDMVFDHNTHPKAANLVMYYRGGDERNLHPNYSSNGDTMDSNSKYQCVLTGDNAKYIGI